MVIVAVAGLALSGGQPAGVPKPDSAKPKTVYVNLDQLVKKHPAWEAVSDTRNVMDSVRSGSVKIAESRSLGDASSYGSAKAAADEAVRKELVTQAISTADEAMMKLEAQQSEAVDAGLKQRRRTMKKSAEAEIMAQVKEIETQTGETVGQIARSHSPERINTELKIAALKNQIGKPGVDSKAAQAKLDAVQSELSKIKEESSAETDRVMSDAKEKIDSLWENSAAQTDAALSIIESSEIRKIKNRSAASRYEILKDLLSLYDSGNKADITSGRERLPNIEAASMPAAGFGNEEIRAWKTDNSALATRIRKDVKDAVIKMARASGVEVVFTRSSSGIPDATDRFAQLMNRNAWQVCSPVLSQVSGS